MKTCDVTRRVSAPGGASPRGQLLLLVDGELSAEFRVQAGRVLARRNRAVLAAASVVKVPAQSLRRVGQRQGLQLALMERRVG
jgi:hypothetical protein